MRHSCIVATAFLCLQTTAHAAGGHYAVDDAAILEPGQCQVELWQERGSSSDIRLNHVGPGCRLGPLEWGLNLDDLRASDGSHQRYFGPQVKWTTALDARWSVGVAVASTWTTQDTRYVGTTAVVPLTWQATSALVLHLNVGWDQQAGAGTQSRRGLAAEWTPTTHWSLLAERFDDHGARHWRTGLRYLVSDAVSLDLSRAARLGPDTRAWWAFGVNWAFSPGARSDAAR